MHDPRDPDALLQDELDRLRTSGFDLSQAVIADLPAEAALARLARLPRTADWSYEEPDDPPSILAALQAPDALRLDVRSAELRDRIAGAWFGRSAGCVLGKPIETWAAAEVERYLRATDQWPPVDYLLAVDTATLELPPFKPSWPRATRGAVAGVPRDDDLDYTVLGLHILETHGFDFTTDDVAAEVLDHLPFTQVYTAERVAYRNLVLGMAPTEAAHVRNPYREWIGSLIRADIYGLTSPGDARRAASLVLRDASLTHTGNGIYAAMWAAAALSAAAAGQAPRDCVVVGLTQVPPASRLHEAIRAVLAMHEDGVPWETALARIHHDLDRYSWVHAINNTAAIAFAALWGDGDFARTVGLAVAAGWDTDSCGATAGALCGAYVGLSGLPAVWVDPLEDRLETAIAGFHAATLSDLAERTAALALGRTPRDRDRDRQVVDGS